MWLTNILDYVKNKNDVKDNNNITNENIYLIYKKIVYGIHNCVYDEFNEAYNIKAGNIMMCENIDSKERSIEGKNVKNLLLSEIDLQQSLVKSTLLINEYISPYPEKLKLWNLYRDARGEESKMKKLNKTRKEFDKIYSELYEEINNIRHRVLTGVFTNDIVFSFKNNILRIKSESEIIKEAYEKF